AGDLMPPGRIDRLQEAARASGEGWRLPPFPAERYGVTDDADVRWMSPKLTSHPLKTMLEPVRLKNEASQALPRTYIYCNNPAYGLFEPYGERAQAEGWPYHELATGHDAMITQPRALAEILLKLA
ncbi:MAG TPA: alpha/beta hydrolase, partial [Terriglobia bacterium]|nr:alpha/beta hydrolase [Terriglobia bacterium]